jgi:AraC-like DNA-binding protein
MLMESALSGKPVHISTDNFPVGRRLAMWQELYCQAIAKFDIRSLNDAPFSASATLRTLPDLGIASSRRTAARSDLTRPSASAPDNFIFLIVTSGTALISQRQREINLSYGDATLLSATEPNATMLHSDGGFLSLAMPSAKLSPSVVNIGSMISRRVKSDNDALRMLRTYIGIVKEADSLSTLQLQRSIALHIHDLVASALGTTQDAALQAEERGIRSARLRAIMLDILDNLHRRDFGVQLVAKRHGVTERYVQRLFEREGTTLRAYLLDQRLAKAYGMISDRHSGPLQITEIAYSAGFRDLSYFGRTFRTKYGASPSDVRAAARTKI